MKYIILFGIVLFSQFSFANQCKSIMMIEVYSNETKIDEVDFVYDPVNRLIKKSVYSLPLELRDRNMFTQEGIRVTNVSFRITDEKGNNLPFENSISNERGDIIMNSSRFSRNDSSNTQQRFAYNLYANLDKNCSISFESNFIIFI